MKKYKVFTVVFIVLFILAFAYGVIATSVLNSIRDDWNEYKDQWDRTGYSYTELWEKYDKAKEYEQEAVLDIPIILQAIINLIDEQASIKRISDTEILAAIVYTEEKLEKLKSYAWATSYFTNDDITDVYLIFAQYTDGSIVGYHFSNTEPSVRYIIEN